MNEESKKLFGEEVINTEAYLTIDEFDTNMCEVAEDFVNLEDRVGKLESRLHTALRIMERLVEYLMEKEDESETEN